VLLASRERPGSSDSFHNWATVTRQGKKGSYWIQFEKQRDGLVFAQASGPIPPVIGAGGFIGPVARVSADTAEEANRLLLQQLESLDA
jgi:hypothetical protein